MMVQVAKTKINRNTKVVISAINEHQAEIDSDAKLWTETFDDMTSEQFANLDAFFEDNAKAGTFALDFSRK